MPWGVEGLLGVLFYCEVSDMMKAASVSLRADITLADVDRMIGWMENPNVTRFLNEDPQIVHFLGQLSANVPEPMLSYHFNRSGRFLLVCTPQGQSIGFVKLTPTRQGCYEIVYVIGDESLWGHGLGTAAIRAAQSRAFLEWGAEELTAKVAPRNSRSVRGLSSCGFRQRGINGKYAQFSLTSQEYLQQLFQQRQKRA